MTDMSDLDTGDNLYHVRKSRLIRLINWWQVRNGERESLDQMEGLMEREPFSRVRQSHHPNYPGPDTRTPTMEGRGLTARHAWFNCGSSVS